MSLKAFQACSSRYSWYRTVTGILNCKLAFTDTEYLHFCREITPIIVGQSPVVFLKCGTFCCPFLAIICIVRAHLNPPTPETIFYKFINCSSTLSQKHLVT